MPGSSTTPGRPGARAHAPVRVAFRFRNGVGTRDMNLCEAQWLAYVLPYRRFAVALTDDHARLGADVVRYTVIASDLHRLLVAGLPAHCEKLLDTTPPPPSRDRGRLRPHSYNDEKADALQRLAALVENPPEATWWRNYCAIISLPKT